MGKLARVKTRIIRIGGSRAGRIARRGFTTAGRAAMSEKHTIAAVLSAAALGYLTRPSSTTELPHIDALGVPATYGIAAWIAGRALKSQVAQHVSTGLLAVAAYSWAKEETPGAARPAARPAARGMDDGIEGEIDDG